MNTKTIFQYTQLQYTGIPYWKQQKRSKETTTISPHIYKTWNHTIVLLHSVYYYYNTACLTTVAFCCFFSLLQPIQPATSSSSSVVSSILQTCLVSVNHLWYLMVIISGLKSVLEIKSFCFCIFPHFFPWINTPGAVPRHKSTSCDLSFLESMVYQRKH